MSWTQERHEAAKARCEGATPAPWTASHYLGGAGEVFSLDADGDRLVHVADCFAGPWNKDAEFIAEARTDLPDVLVEIERLQAEAAWVSVDDALPTRTYPGGEPVEVLIATEDGGWGMGRYVRGPDRGRIEVGSWYYYGHEGYRSAHWLRIRYWRYVTPPVEEEA